MSIFKSTFKPYICRQINARQDLVSISDNRPIEVLQYTTAKSPWVKATSFVNYNNNGYSGDQLARKYVLYGGTLYPNSDKIDEFSLRYGIGSKNSAYGGNLGNRDYGLVPMPGIDSVNIKSKSAYGSLRETVIKYYCWDKKQLEELEILFMRPGYTVLLEWGWSMYIDSFDPSDSYDANPDEGSIKKRISLSSKLSNHSLIKTFDDPTIDPFQSGLTQDILYDKIAQLQFKHSGNYDACLGKIVNFSWRLLPNGGYECTTVLISIGDVLETLKMNSSTGMSIYDQDKTDYKTEFELLMEKMLNYQFNDPVIIDINNKIKFPNDIDIHPKIVRFVNNATDDHHSRHSKKYIQFAYFIHILNERFNLFNGEEKLIDIEIPVYNKKNKGNGLCLASKDSISIDPDVCILRNSRAINLTGDDVNGFDLISGVVQRGTENINRAEGNLPMKEYLLVNSTFGIIGNLYVSINRIMDIYRELIRNNNGSVGVGALLSGVLKDLNFALGSINDFDIYVNDNKAVIIDKFYTEFGADAEYNTKFQLNLIGNNSVLRELNVVSKIFPSQTTMIAIAAQSRANIAGIQSSTNNYLNNGLTDRLIEKSVEYASKQQENEGGQLDTLIRNIQDLSNYVRDFLMKLILPDETMKTSANSFLNSLILKINKDANYKAIIPISFEFSIDGLGGVTIGEIFTVNPDSLPKDYNDKRIGFIVTGIGHSIVRSDWRTHFTTQICLLDQQKLNTSSVANNAAFFGLLNNKVSEDINKLSLSIKYYDLLAAFIKDFSERRIVFDKDRLHKNNATEKNIIVLGGSSLAISTGTSVKTPENKLPCVTEVSILQNGLSTEGIHFDGFIRTMDDRFNEQLRSVQNVKNSVKSTLYYLNMDTRVRDKFDEQFNNYISAVNSNKSQINFQCLLQQAVTDSGLLNSNQVYNRSIKIDNFMFQ